MEFHVSRASRDKYQFDQVLFSLNGNVIFANFQAARQFAAQINAQKKPGDKGFVSPGQINALGLIDEIFHLIVSQYYQEYGKDIREALYTELISYLNLVHIILSKNNYNRFLRSQFFLDINLQ